MFESLRDSWRESNDDFLWEVPEGWGQGRAVFGGLVVAAAAALGARATPRPLRTIFSQLLAPLHPGPALGQRRVLREGKTATVVEVRLLQNDRLMCTCTMTFAQGIAKSPPIAGPAAPDWGAPEDHEALPYLPGLTPEFTQHLELRFAEGLPPFFGAPEAKIGGFVQFRDDARAASTERTLGLLDAWPCPTLSTLSAPAAASTVTWTAHLLAPPQAGLHGFRYETLATSAGFSTAVGRLWGGDGRLVAFTEQTVAVFAPK